MGIGNANYVYWEEAANVGAPFILTPPVISGLISVGSVLTSTQGTVSAAGTTTYAYQWMKNPVVLAFVMAKDRRTTVLTPIHNTNSGMPPPP